MATKYGIEILHPKDGWLPYAPYAYTFKYEARAQVEAAQLGSYFPGTEFRAVVLPSQEAPAGIIVPEVWK